MRQREFLTIFATYNALPTIRQTLPSVIEETKRAGAALIVHDSTEDNRAEVWSWLQDLNADNDFFLILSSNMSMAHARNMCLRLGVDMFAPQYICMMEDDHGFMPGLIPEMTAAMRQYYGKESPNGLRYGLFTACRTCWAEHKYHETPAGHSYPDADLPPVLLGGANSCFRCAPASHWNAVLKGYDSDEYLISNFQTSNCNLRNYHNGFTALAVRNGNLIFTVDRMGRGVTLPLHQRPYDVHYSASDRRSRYCGKPYVLTASSNVDVDALQASPRGASISGFSEQERSADGECWRWALGPESAVVVECGGICRGELEFQFVSPVTTQEVEIAWNGTALETVCTSAVGSGVSRRLPVTFQIGQNWLTFRYSDWNGRHSMFALSDRRPMAVRFTCLRLTTDVNGERSVLVK